MDESSTRFQNQQSLKNRKGNTMMDANTHTKMIFTLAHRVMICMLSYDILINTHHNKFQEVDYYQRGHYPLSM